MHYLPNKKKLLKYKKLKKMSLGIVNNKKMKTLLIQKRKKIVKINGNWYRNNTEKMLNKFMKKISLFFLFIIHFSRDSQELGLKR